MPNVRIVPAASLSTSAAVRSQASAAKEVKREIQTIAPEGTVLKGINILKSGQDPVALADSEYPDWLWEVLDPAAQARKLDADPELKARKEWRKKNRASIKTANFLKSVMR
ncbi:mitochondrial 54S ribosomal protein mL54 [Dipodascopsis tothii]|uniref:mitochondrial 54S ribosomal protein mL54 n=1 Tax=Dipodascopsis tothii TaxID=44089 RepID=UPI0034CEE309